MRPVAPFPSPTMEHHHLVLPGSPWVVGTLRRVLASQLLSSGLMRYSPTSQPSTVTGLSPPLLPPCLRIHRLPSTGSSQHLNPRFPRSGLAHLSSHAPPTHTPWTVASLPSQLAHPPTSWLSVTPCPPLLYSVTPPPPYPTVYLSLLAQLPIRALPAL
jgi:hypothetical protein